MLETEVLIIGGGPAGSTLARALVQAGKNVTVMDKALFPRSKVCAGWITPAVLKALEIRPADYAAKHVLQSIHGFQTSRLGAPPVYSEFPGEPVSYGIRRIEFDNFLLRRCGARLLLGRAFKSMRRDYEGWVINDDIRARLVVGAGGHFCPVARFIGAKEPSETVVAAQEIEFEMSSEQKARCPVRAEVPELFFSPDCKGYGWVFRKGDYLNIGLGREDRHRLSEQVSQFIDHLAGTGRIPETLPAKLNGHAYLLYPHRRRPLVQDGVMLIGDAAGLAYAQSGEGIRPAVESALLAADTIAKCADEYSTARLGGYLAKLNSRFGQVPAGSPSATKIPVRLKQAVAAWLMRNHFLSKNLLIRQWFLRVNDKHLVFGQMNVL